MEVEENKEELDPRTKALFVEGYKTTVKSFEPNPESENAEAYTAKIEVIFANEDDAKVWLDKFQKQMGIKYAIKNSRRAQPRSRLAVYSILICNRNTRRKTGYSSKVSRPHTGCPSKLSLKVSKPTYFVRDFVGNIVIYNDHNHTLGDVEEDPKAKEGQNEAKKDRKKSPKKKIIAEPCVEVVPTECVYEVFNVFTYEDNESKENGISVASSSKRFSLAEIYSEIDLFSQKIKEDILAHPEIFPTILTIAQNYVQLESIEQRMAFIQNPSKQHVPEEGE